MNLADLSWTALANHLWQSTVFAAVIWLLTLALKKNRAAVSYRLWFAASFKFLIPFSLLVTLGSRLSWQTIAPVAQPSQLSMALDSAVQPFTGPIAPAQTVSPQTSFSVTPILLAVWLCGVAVGVAFWLKCWMQMRRIRGNTTPLPLSLPIPALSSPSQIEPGVFGIFRPVLLLPEAIQSRLTPIQLDAVLAHEMAHVRRRDNLTAAIHMIVETVVWFFPVVWWLRARLVEERELACDEEVLRLGSEPQVYAEGILNVCKSYLSSPLACASGVSGSDLKRRIQAIITNRVARNLDARRGTLLIAGGAVALIGPIAVGIVGASPTRGQTSAESAVPGFDAASVKPHQDTGRRTTAYSIEPGRITCIDCTLGDLIAAAYGVKHYQLSGSDWIVHVSSSVTYDVVATAGKPVGVEQVKRMLGPLLAERFHLAFHRETRELPVFALIVANGGPKFKEPGDGGDHSISPDGNGGVYFKNYSMDDLANWLTMLPSTGRPVIDHTGLTGSFSFDANLFDLEKGASPGELKSTMVSADAVDTLRVALPEQLGLKLEEQRAPIEMLVIDHADRVPTAN